MAKSRLSNKVDNNPKPADCPGVRVSEAGATLLFQTMNASATIEEYATYVAEYVIYFALRRLTFLSEVNIIVRSDIPWIEQGSVHEQVIDLAKLKTGLKPGPVSFNAGPMQPFHMTFQFTGTLKPRSTHGLRY